MGVLHQQHADFQKLFLPVRQQSRAAIPLGAQAQQRQHFVDAVALL